MPDPPKEPSDPTGPGSDAAEALAELERVLLRIGGAQALVADVRELRDLLINRRPPRVAVIGRRGSGKSSLANALLGAEALPTGAAADTTKAPAWVDILQQGRRLRWLDTPGLRAGDSPGRRDEVRRALAGEPPDVVLVTARATQVDAGIDEDLAEVAWLLERQKSVGLAPPAVIAVVTRVDELPPVTEKSPPFGDTKRGHVDKAVAVLREHLVRAKIETRAVIPVGAYQRFFSDHTLAVDWRWNLDVLGEAVFAALPTVAQVEAARAFDAGRGLRRRVAVRLIRAATSIAFLVGTTPLPIADLALLAPLQTAMVTGIVFLAGRPVDRRTVSEWIAGMGLTGGLGFALREAARALVRMVPGIGGPVSGAIAATGTWALGMSATRYFIDGATIEAAREAFQTARREGPPRELTGGTAVVDPTAEPGGSRDEATRPDPTSTPPDPTEKP